MKVVGIENKRNAPIIHFRFRKEFIQLELNIHSRSTYIAEHNIKVESIFVTCQVLDSRGRSLRQIGDQPVTS